MATWNSVGGNYREEDVSDDKWSNVQVTHDDFSRQPSLATLTSGTWSTTAAKRSKKRKRCIALCVALVLLTILIGAISIGVAVKVEMDKDNSSTSNNSNPLKSLITACNATLYPTVCYDSLKNITNSSTTSLDFVKYAIAVAADAITRESTVVQTLYVNTTGGDTVQLNGALHDCVLFLQDSTDSLNQTVDSMKSLSVTNLDDDLADLKTWMSAALTNQESCVDGVRDANATSSPVLEFLNQGNETSMLVSNALAFVTTLKDIIGDLPVLPGHRRLLTSGETTMGIFQRRLLQSAASPPNLVVAQDGSGNFTRINDAIKYYLQTKGSNTKQFVIHIKAGTYLETVIVPKTTPNLVFQGDGIGKTIISGSLSVIGSNVTTSMSATLTVQGKNFVGRDFTVENTAGAVNHQAVALRVTGDFSAFQSCQFLGYQDTLYAHTNRQFYTNCTVVGTLDFIFGNAAVVFQSSQILATTGIVGQQNTFTASGRTDPNQNTGISFQDCTFDGTASLRKIATGTFQTYLGRPWKPYATTVIMESIESSLVDPAGWLNWNGQVFSTVYFAEYKNTGPGSGVSKRVSWSQQITMVKDANKFSVDSFIQGNSWLPKSNLTYQKSV